MARGPIYKWLSETPTSGRFIMTFPRRVPLVTYISFESSFELIFDMCGVKGRVAPSEISADGVTGSISVFWVKR
jgi:hypothetical protein